MLALYLFVMPLPGPNQFALPLFLIFSLSNICFLWTIRKDPGYIKKSDNISFVKLNKYFQPAYICPKCEIIRSRDSNHCHYCNKCVDRFDHHCPWVDNCVGHGNHNQFMMFIVTMWLFLISIDFVCFYNIDMEITYLDLLEAENAWYGFALRMFELRLYPEFTTILVDIILISCITIASLFLIPVSMLL